MKQNFFIPFAVIVLLTTAFSLTSCKKDKTEQFKLTLNVNMREGGTIQVFSNEERTKIIPNLSTINKGTKVYLKATLAKNSVVDKWVGIDGTPTDAAKTLATVVVNGNKTVTVHFIISQVVSFEMNGGTPEQSPIVVAPGQKITQPLDPVKTGYAFTGWYKESALISPWDFENDVVGTQSIKLYAKWTDVAYTVTLDPNGGTSGLNTFVKVQQGGYLNPNTMAHNTNPTRTDHLFKGWFTDQATTVQWTAEMPVTADMTLYAKWIAVHKVTFASNGGSEVVQVMTEDKKTIAKPQDPTKEGYTFNYWSKNPELTSEWIFLTDKVEASITLYAKWTANTYTVVYNKNNGDATGTTTSTTHTYDVAKSLTTNGYTLVGHDFDKWATTAGGSGEYTDGLSVTNLTSMNGATITLYALWNPKSYNVTFTNQKPEGANVEVENFPSSPIEVVYNQLIGNPITPTLTGYLFLGWYTDQETATTPWNFATNKMPADNITFYPRWAKAHRVTLHYNNGTTDLDQSPDFPENIQKPFPVVTRENYEFLNWNTAVDGTGDANIGNYTASSPITLYAQWKYTGSYSAGDYYPDPEVKYNFTFSEGNTATSGTPAIGIVFDAVNKKLVDLKKGIMGTTNTPTPPSGWILPTIDEFETLYRLYNGQSYLVGEGNTESGYGNTDAEKGHRQLFNQKLTAATGDKLSENDEIGVENYHWSSTQGSNRGFKTFSLNQGKQEDNIITSGSNYRHLRFIKSFE